MILTLTAAALALEPVTPAAAATPEGLAAQLTLVERTLRDGSLPLDADLLTYGHLQQVIYRALAVDPQTAEGILQLLHDLAAEGRCVLMATHNHDILRRRPGRILQCDQGKLKELSAPPVLV